MQNWSLEIKDATLTIGGKQLFAGLSFYVNVGETLCITGVSGSGKTSLLRALMGFVPLGSGFISMGGEALTPLTAELFRAHIAYVPQEVALPYDEIADMVKAPFLLKANATIKFSKEALLTEFAKLGLAAELYDKRVSEVSGGERQRIMLAVAGLLKKPFVLVDEPTSALDSNTSERVAAYFKELASQGAAVLAVSHDDTLAAQFSKQLQLSPLS